MRWVAQAQKWFWRYADGYMAAAFDVSYANCHGLNDFFALKRPQIFDGSQEYILAVVCHSKQAVT